MATFANQFALLADMDEGAKAEETSKVQKAAGKKFKPATFSVEEKEVKPAAPAAAEAPRRGREFDRHVSGTGRLKGEMKKGGAGKGNWGTAADEVAAEGDRAVEKEKTEAEIQAEADAAKELEEEAKKMTLADYKRMQQEKVVKAEAARAAGEGEDAAKWKDAVAAERDAQEVFAVGEKERKEKHREVKEKVLLETNFTVASAERGERRERGRGRGRGGRGGFRGERRERDETAPAAPAAEGAAPAEERPAGDRPPRRGGRGGFRGERGAFRGGERGAFRGGERGAFRGGRGRGNFHGERPEAQARLDINDTNAFPTLA